MCGSTYGNGLIIQFMSFNMAASKNMSALICCYTKYTSFDIVPVLMNCTLGMYQWKVR